MDANRQRVASRTQVSISSGQDFRIYKIDMIDPKILIILLILSPDAEDVYNPDDAVSL